MEPFWWLALGRVPGIGPITYVRLLKHFGSPEKVFQAPLRDLRMVDRVGDRLALAIKEFSGFSVVEEELSRLETLGVDLLMLGGDGYPPSLAAIPDPPPYLYIKGRILPEDLLAVGIVGSRSATGYGLRTTFRIARELARNGVTVVSGLARGIDAEAHKGALAGGGRTLAVLGSGINVIYPPEHRPLLESIAERGAVLTEYPLDTEPEAGHFPSRNRIISGLSLGVTIVEAAPKSGSLITARLALEQGREVFAVPGSVESLRSRGPHALIRQGARLVESAQDILEELAPMLHAWARRDGSSSGRPMPEEEDLTPEEREILESLGPEPLHIDEVIERGGKEPSVTSAILLQLELKGRVRQMPGKHYMRLE